MNRWTCAAMDNFCTLFDSRYLARALVMYRSLASSCTGEFSLYALCMDDEAYSIVMDLALPRIVPLRLADFETQRLLTVKPSRSRGEYCWTCTPFVIGDTLARYGLDEVTYLDADLCFYSSPSPMLQEVRAAGDSVSITPHRYSPQYDYASSCGIYCVQFVTAKADRRGIEVLQWWQDRCIEWCYARYEAGKFGDQKYLDDWPTRFDGIHVLHDVGAGVGPWNVQQYDLRRGDDGLRVDGRPLVFFHFHDYRYFRGGQHDFGHYRLPRAAIDLIYVPYAQALTQAYDDIRRLRPGFSGGWSATPAGWRDKANYARRWIAGVANRRLIA
jgi:hypothetical protein